MKAIKPIKSGEEIFNDYGPLPRSDLLRRYGYISSRYSQYDVVEFSLQSICDAAGVADPGSKLGYLEDLGLLDDGYAINRTPVDGTLAEAIPDDMAIVISTLISRESQEKNKKPPKPRLNLTEAKVLQRLVSRRQAAFATTLDEDKATRERFGQGNGPQEHINHNRLRMATEVRLGEKEILQQLSDLISVFIADNEESNKRSRANQMDTNTKKQRVR
jgi:N-lysine methyltransferase SETD6